MSAEQLDPQAHKPNEQRALPAGQTEPVHDPFSHLPDFDSFGGLDSEIEQLRTIGELYRNPQLCEEWEVECPTGVLLHGPGGVGKSRLAKALARDIRAELLVVEVSDILGKWVGDANKGIKETFDKAAKVEGPVIVLFDEMDGLLAQGAGGNDGVYRSVLSEMKSRLDNLKTVQPNTLVVGTSNSVDGFEPALLRPGRFDVVLGIGLPDAAARSSIFGKIMDSTFDKYDFWGNEEYPAINLDELSAQTEGFSGADINAILKAARTKKLLAQLRTKEEGLRVTHLDLLEAIRAHRHSRPNTLESDS